MKFQTFFKIGIIGFVTTVALSEVFAGVPLCRGAMRGSPQHLSRQERDELINLDGERMITTTGFRAGSQTFLSLLPLFYVSSVAEKIDKVSTTTGVQLHRYQVLHQLNQLVNDNAMNIDLSNFDKPFADLIQQRISKVLSYELKNESSVFLLNPGYILKLAKSSSRFSFEKYLPLLQIKTTTLLNREFSLDSDNPKLQDVTMALAKDVLSKEFGLPYNANPRVYLDGNPTDGIDAQVLSLSNFRIAAQPRNRSAASSKVVFSSHVYSYEFADTLALSSTQPRQVFKIFSAGKKSTALVDIAALKSKKIVVNRRPPSPDYESMWRDGKLTGLILIGDNISDSRYLLSEYKEYYEEEGYRFEPSRTITNSREYIANLIESGEADYLAKEDNGGGKSSLTANVLVGRKNIKGKGIAIVHLINGSTEVGRGSATVPVVRQQDWQLMFERRRMNRASGDLVYINTKCSSFCTEIAHKVMDPRFVYIAPESLADTFTNESSTAILHILRGLQRGWSYKQIMEKIKRNQDPDDSYNEYIFPNDRQWDEPNLDLYRTLFQVKFMSSDKKVITADKFYQVPEK